MPGAATYERAGHVATITYNRPNALNAVNGHCIGFPAERLAEMGLIWKVVPPDRLVEERRVASATDDASEGIAARMEDRPPRWRGR